jgi:hypothetical protein
MSLNSSVINTLISTSKRYELNNAPMKYTYGTSGFRDRAQRLDSVQNINISKQNININKIIKKIYSTYEIYEIYNVNQKYIYNRNKIFLLMRLYFCLFFRLSYVWGC